MVRQRRALVRWFLVAAVLLVTSISFLLDGPSHAPAHAQDPCQGLLATRLSVGGAGRVTAAYGLQLKANFNSTAALRTLDYGTVVTLTGEFRCGAGLRRWPVQLADGTAGWVAENDDEFYYLEPYTMGLYTFRTRQEGAEIVRYFVTPDAYAVVETTFTVAPANTTVGQAWQQVEVDFLNSALGRAQENCPQKLLGTVWDGVVGDADALEAIPLPPLDYDFYPSADGNRLVLVRHLTLPVPRCGTVLDDEVGISQVSVLDADGTETVLFPYPQHGTVPESTDGYVISAPERPRVYLDEVVWSPNGAYIGFVAAYLDTCTDGGCYRYHMYVWDNETGDLYQLGEGRQLHWTEGGAQLQFFRLESGDLTRQTALLFSAQPNGTNRQQIGLPGGAIYITNSQTPLGFPWNVGGTRVLVGNGGVAEVMLFALEDRSFGSRIAVPDQMPLNNRLAVHLVKSDTALLWTTIRGEFAVQNVVSGDWRSLTASVAETGVAPAQVRPFGDGIHALVDMVNGTAYVLDMDADVISQVLVRQ
ncbi:MAG: hypothetical protein GYB65_10405 [Chloroflexi bacterium]|nr:hypothetical protein [Chloroflexota bacterium]